MGGGGYLRLLPYWLTRYGLRRAARQGVPLITYLHPWEMDPDQPRLPGRLLSRFRHYTNLARMSDRLRSLCHWVDYVPFREFDAGEVICLDSAWRPVPPAG